MALGPTTLSHLQRRTLIRTRNPKREKNSQQQQQPVKEVEQEEWANNAQYTATQVTVRMSCTPKLMQFQALIKFVILSRSKQPLSSVLKTGNMGALRLWITTHEQREPRTATHGALPWGLTSWSGTRLLPLLVASFKGILRSTDYPSSPPT